MGVGECRGRRRRRTRGVEREEEEEEEEEVESSGSRAGRSLPGRCGWVLEVSGWVGGWFE